MSAEINENVDEPAVAEPAAAAAEADDYRDKYLRLQADLDNYRKRMDRNVAEANRRRKADLLLTFLPILDNLTRALEAAESAPAADGLLEGVKLTSEQFAGVLKRHGVSRIPAGDEFDPHLHEVVATTPSDEAEEGSILEELATGYLLDGEVLRATAVRVATRAPEPAGPADEGDSSAEADSQLDVQA